VSKISRQKKRWIKYYYELGEGITVNELGTKYEVSPCTIRTWIRQEAWRGGICDLCSAKYIRREGYKICDSYDYDLNFCSVECMFAWKEEEEDAS